MDKSHIRLFVPTYDVESCLSAIRECLEVGWTGAGYKTEEFEQKWTNYSKLKNSLFLNSNSGGILIALESLKIKNSWEASTEIISTALTFVSTNHAIVQAGLKPIFADIDESLNLDPQSVKRAITPNTKAVIFVGIGGNPQNYLEIVEICKEFKLALILDAAHMAGTQNSVGFIGKESDFSVFSFQAVKNLPTADSGMLNSNDEELSSIARKLSWLGISSSTYERNSKIGAYKWEYDVDYLGYKANGNSIMAAIAMVQLDKLESDNIQRRRIAKIYESGLANLSGISIVEHDETNYLSARHLFQIRVLDGKRDEYIKKLNDEKIDVGVHYRLNSRYRAYSHLKDSLEKAYEYEAQIISLPLHLRLTSYEVERIIETLIDLEN